MVTTVALIVALLTLGLESESAKLSHGRPSTNAGKQLARRIAIGIFVIVAILAVVEILSNGQLNLQPYRDLFSTIAALILLVAAIA